MSSTPMILESLRLVWCCNKIWNWIKLPTHLVGPVHQQQAATKGLRRRKERNQEKIDSTHKDIYFIFIKTRRMVMMIWGHHGNHNSFICPPVILPRIMQDIFLLSSLASCVVYIFRNTFSPRRLQFWRGSLETLNEAQRLQGFSSTSAL